MRACGRVLGPLQLLTLCKRTWTLVLPLRDWAEQGTHLTTNSFYLSQLSSAKTRSFAACPAMPTKAMDLDNATPERKEQIVPLQLSAPQRLDRQLLRQPASPQQHGAPTSPPPLLQLLGPSLVQVDGTKVQTSSITGEHTLHLTLQATARQFGDTPVSYCPGCTSRYTLTLRITLSCWHLLTSVCTLQLCNSRPQPSVTTHQSLPRNPHAPLGPNKVIGLYFSADWCPPCHRVTPHLAAIYRSFKAQHPRATDWEVVFVSSDRDEAAFQQHHATMPWPALPYRGRTAKDALSRLCKVRATVCSQSLWSGWRSPVW